MDDRGAALTRLHHPAERDRVRLRHRGALDEDAVRVHEGARGVGGAAAPVGGPQTGDRRGVSYAGLVLDLDGAHRGERLLDQVVLLVVERGAAEVGEAERAVDPVALVAEVLPAVLAGGDPALGDHVHRRLEVDLLPLGRVRPAVLDLHQPPRLLYQLARRGALGAQRALVDRGLRVALDVDELAAPGVDHLAAADRAVRADGLGRLEAGDPSARLLRAARDRARAEAPIGRPADQRQPAQAVEARRARHRS